jgi:NAD-dependent DNA ligase
MRIYVTGKVEGTTKKDLKKILAEHGHEYTSFKKDTELLVFGERSGPKKLEKARSWGIRTLSWSDFVQEFDIKYPTEGNG